MGKRPEELMHLVGWEAVPMGQLHAMGLRGPQSWESRGSQIGCLPVTWSYPRRKEEGAQTLGDVTVAVREVMVSFPWWAPLSAACYQHANHLILPMIL